ncbi:hypothetical protein [Paenibacillus sp. Marseille-Q9583]
MLTQVFAIVRKSDGKPAFGRALYLTETRAKISMRGYGSTIGNYRIVRIGGAVTPVWETNADGRWVNVEKTEVSADVNV